jgi:hypothetical protein
MHRFFPPGFTRYIYGDLVHDVKNHLVGPIEETVFKLEPVDLFVCSETLEHLDDPDRVLALIRKRTKYLLISTPIGEYHTENPEHYWGWDVDGVRAMVDKAGFKPLVINELYLPGRYYDFQIWACG